MDFEHAVNKSKPGNGTKFIEVPSLPWFEKYMIPFASTAYLETGDFNVIGVDWSKLASSNFYPWSKSYTNPVGRYASFPNNKGTREPSQV